MQLTNVCQPYFPFVTRTLLDLWQSGQLPDVAALGVDPTFGHVGRITYHDGSVRMFRASSSGVNSQGAADIARDKADTRLFLQSLGYTVPPGRLFARQHYRQQLARQLGAQVLERLGDPEQASAWVEEILGYPCYLKPNNSSQGRGVACCHSRTEIETTLEGYRRDGIALFLIEAAVPWPDYRVVVLGKRVVAAYERRPLGVVGDGRATIGELIAAKAEALRQAGKVFDTTDLELTARLLARGLSPASIPKAGEQLRLSDVSNLSAGGSAVDVGDSIGAAWQALCVRVVADIGLTFCGVDLACPDIGGDPGPYAILELNSAPGLEHYAALGEDQLRRTCEIYRALFGRPPMA